MRRDGTARERPGREDPGRDGTGRRGTRQDSKERDGTGRDGTRRAETGPDETVEIQSTLVGRDGTKNAAFPNGTLRYEHGVFTAGRGGLQIYVLPRRDGTVDILNWRWDWTLHFYLQPGYIIVCREVLHPFALQPPSGQGGALACGFRNTCQSSQRSTALAVLVRISDRKWSSRR